ncbi:MAG: cytochrome c [Burkholderiaceae bacterium]|nr:cytochrome c [Burkholderiaceae bacterium]
MQKGGFAMFLLKNIIVATIAVGSLTSPAFAYDFGRAPTPQEIKLWDIDVRPDGKGLPEGSGTVTHGKTVYEQNCLACHGANGKDGIKDRLAGGQGTLASEKPIKTVGSYWPYATTLFDYIRRAMPYQTPGSLNVDDTYAVTAYILGLNGLLPEDGQLNKETLVKITMPNHDGFIPEAEFQKITNSK